MNNKKTKSHIECERQYQEKVNEVCNLLNEIELLKKALDVWDKGEYESLSSLLNRTKLDLESGNIIVEGGAYNLLMKVIETQRQVLINYMVNRR